MNLEKRDIRLLQYLAEQNTDIEIHEKKVPHQVRIDFKFYGLSKVDSPDSIWVHLHEMEQFGLVKRQGSLFRITDTGEAQLGIINQRAAEHDIVKRKELQKLELEITDLSKRVADYEESQTNTRYSARASIVSAIVAVLAMIISMMPWICNRHV